MYLNVSETEYIKCTSGHIFGTLGHILGTSGTWSIFKHVYYSKFDRDHFFNAK